MRRTLCAAILSIAAAATVVAQQPAEPQPPPAAAPAPPKAEAEPPRSAASTPPQPENYTYNPEGRRDPFLSLVGAGVGDRSGGAPSRRSEGAAGLLVNEITVRGVMQSRGMLLAMVQGPDNKTYIVHQGDKLLDGQIKSITPQGLIIIQEVNDPLSLVKQREVPKLLRSLESVKQ